MIKSIFILTILMFCGCGIPVSKGTVKRKVTETSYYITVVYVEKTKEYSVNMSVTEEEYNKIKLNDNILFVPGSFRYVAKENYQPEKE